MSSKKIILVSIIIISISLLISATAYTKMIKVNESYQSSKIKSKNLVLLIDDIKNSYEERIQNIHSKHQLDLKKLENKLNKSVSIYQNNTNDFSNESYSNINTNTYLNRMERLQEEDMDEYLRIMKERKDRIDAMQYNSATRASIYMNMDTSFMNIEEKENHDLLLDNMARIFELTQEFENIPEISNREIWQKIGPLIRETRPMMEMERNVIFRKTFSDKFGLDQNESKEFTDYIDHLIDATTISPMRMQNPNNN